MKIDLDRVKPVGGSRLTKEECLRRIKECQEANIIHAVEALKEEMKGY